MSRVSEKSSLATNVCIATCPWSRVYTDFAGPINDQIVFILIDAHFEGSRTTPSHVSPQQQQFSVVDTFLPLVRLR